MKERDLAETTAERYEGILRNYIEPYLGRRALSEIKEPAIRQWRKTLQDVGVGAATIGKAYRMVHSMFNTAVDDLLIRRSPCRIKGAGQDKADERPTLTIEQVFAVADAFSLVIGYWCARCAHQPAVRGVCRIAAAGRRG
jgi:site-specific recombinase XerD